MIHNLAKICSGKEVFIQTHNFPDVDAIASAWGLQYLLAHYGVKSKLIYCGDINRSSTERLVECYHIPIQAHSGQFSDEDYIVDVDCQPGQLNISQTGGHILACVDHHPLFDNSGLDFKFVQTCGACASHIANEFLQNNIDMPEGIATALLFALKMDTLQFTRGVTAYDIDMFKYLHGKADDNTIHLLENMNIELTDLRAFGSAIENIRIVGDIGLSYVPFDCPDGLIGALADFILGVNELNVVVVFSQRQDGIKLSVRSIISFVDAGRFIRISLEEIGSGGGHAMFAGGFIPQKNIEQYGSDDFYQYISAKFLRAYGQCLMESVE